MSLAKLKEALNALLPDTIVVKGVKKVPDNFHAQFAAKAKTYRYTILNRRFSTPFLERYVHLIRYPLNIGLMCKESKVLLGQHDFSAFQGSNRIAKSAVRNIKKIKISRKDAKINIEITADGFLYNMVRNIVGTLIEIGRGKYPAGSIQKILESCDRRKAGPTAPAKGLCLVSVKY
jgi:tRNA pseudouridine38-40 synthase